jgi:pantoate--beta-alanine ligase
MELHETIASLRSALNEARRQNKSIGFVPTMGALHAGHRSLIERSAGECDVTVVSIFVNPLQFGPNEDLAKYPRALEADTDLARNAGAAHVFAPSVNEMYPNGALLTSVRVGEISEVLEGLIRPGHFDGVATVVTKLFAIVGQCRAYFGEKDWQQLAVVRQMVKDLSIPVEVIGCPIVRDIDGLALSSRNVYLDGDEREAALSLSRALKTAQKMASDGRRSPLDLIAAMTDVLSEQPLVSAEYATVVGVDFRMPAFADPQSRLLIAARVGTTRLIDNMEIVEGSSHARH